MRLVAANHIRPLITSDELRHRTNDYRYLHVGV